MIIVEASLKHPNSINRTNLNCMENDQPAVCMNLKICFTYTGREVPGYIGKLLGKIPVNVFISNAPIYRIMLLVFSGPLI